MPAARVRLTVTGVVQGVGFRPWVYAAATGRGLGGSVRNGPAGAEIEVEGDPDAVAAFVSSLADGGPERACVDEVVETSLPPRGEREFTILRSRVDPDAPGTPTVSPDLAVCNACLAEVADPRDRRHRYPFTTCTACGPRYTIVADVPYDRARTTMSRFSLCDECAAEYGDPAGRRHHAEPIACPACGPTLHCGTARGDRAIDAAVAAIGRGGVVAVKGVGGYQIAADATMEEAVVRLRRSKRRPTKPLAVMVADLAAAGDLCTLSPAARGELRSAAAPIVLVPRRVPGPLAPSVCCGVADVGVMLPTTPLHRLLVDACGTPLVLTSGNRDGDPIAHTDEEGRELASWVDAVLDHDRPIRVRCDDSVVRVAGSRRQVLRRSRGYVPLPFELPSPVDRPLLALGGHLKSTVALAVGRRVVASHHLGDMGTAAGVAALQQAVTHLCRLCRVDPAVLACDAHPEYVTSKIARTYGTPVVEVFHHHAHVASCLLEHGVAGPVLAVAFDGHGWGPDGTLWGGEILVADLSGFRRVGHVRQVPLPGGAAAIREPWRAALAWLDSTDPELARDRAARTAGGDVVLAQCGAATTPITSSAGRVFDAAAALCGVAPGRVGYEGEAALALEAVAAPPVPIGRGAPAGADLDPPLVSASSAGVVLDPAPLLVSLAAAVDAGGPVPALAAGFVERFAAATAAAVRLAAARERLHEVVLTGGVMQNLRFESTVSRDLRRHGFEVLCHGDIPANDGGLSLGQAAVAAVSL